MTDSVLFKPFTNKGQILSYRKLRTPSLNTLKAGKLKPAEGDLTNTTFKCVYSIMKKRDRNVLGSWGIFDLFSWVLC